MNRQIKVLTQSFSAALLAIAAGSASATPVADCSTISSIDAWQTAGNTCIIGDKQFTLIDTDLNLLPYTSDFAISFANFGLNYSFIGSTGITGTGNVAGDNEFITYTIQVLDPAYYIYKVTVDSNVSDIGSGVTTVTKSIFDAQGALLDTLVSTDGSLDTSVTLNNTFLKVTDTISVGLGDTLTGFNNGIFQARVPEPASIALLGAGLLGLVGLRRRAQKSA